MGWWDKMTYPFKKLGQLFTKEGKVIGPKLYKGVTVTVGIVDIVTSPKSAATLLTYVATEKPTDKELLHMLEAAGDHDIKDPVFLMKFTIGVCLLLLPEEGEVMKILEEAGEKELAGLECDGLSYAIDEKTSVSVADKDALEESGGKYTFKKGKGFSSKESYKKASMKRPKTGRG